VKLENSDFPKILVEFKPGPGWARDLLDEMGERPVHITRTRAKELCRAMFGPAELRHLPPGRGRRILSLPNGNDALILDYAARAPLFQPRWVTGRLRRGAVRTVLRPGLRLQLFLSAWLEPVLGLLRISKGERSPMLLNSVHGDSDQRETHLEKPGGVRRLK
jgi:hypothetical protein